MKKLRFCLFGFFIIIFSCLSACKMRLVGLGEAVDLEASVLTVTSPVIKNGVTTYLPSVFTLKGTCVDNKVVDKVEVTFDYNVNGIEEKKILSADIDGNEWFLEVNVQRDFNIVVEGASSTSGETGDSNRVVTTLDVKISIVAYDLDKNTSENSVSSIIACVDATPPSVDSFSIKKNDKVTEFKEISEVILFDDRSSADKDDLQNEEFTIIATMRDNYSMEKTYLTLYECKENGEPILDEDGNYIYALKDRIQDNINENRFRPEWKIKKEDLQEVSETFASGKHYLSVMFECYDGASNIAPYIPYPVYMCWYPESDLAKVLFPNANDNLITISVGSEIQIDIFDDDGLSEIHYGLVEPTDDIVSGRIDAEAIYKISEKESKLLSKESGDYSDFVREAQRKYKPIEEKDIDGVMQEVPMAGFYYLSVAVKDRKSNGRENVWSYYSIPVNIGNTDKPIIIMESPQENTSAELTNGSFDFTGYSLDDESVGKKIAIAWLPEGQTQFDELTKLWLNQFVNAKNPKSPSVYEGGIKIWKPTIKKSTNSSMGKIRDDFTQKFNVLEDFKVDGVLRNDSKFFVVYIEDAMKNVSTKTYRLGSYDDGPTIKVQYSTASTGPYTPFNEAMLTFSDEGTIYFKVTAEHPKGLSLDYTTFNVTSVSTLNDLVVKDSEMSFNVEARHGQVLEMVFKIEDVFGNKTEDKKTLVFDEASILEKITSDLRTDSTLAGGAKLTIQANFTGNVTVKGKPYINLSNISGVTGEQHAVYESGSGSDTLVFAYVVPDGAYTASGVYVGTPTSSPIIATAGASIPDGDINPDGKTFDSIEQYHISLDAVAPKLVVETCTPKKDEIISGNTITLSFDDDIYAESGTVTVKRVDGWAIPPVLDEDTFKSIYASVVSKDKKTLIGTDTGEPELLENAGTPKGPYKRITHGIKFVYDSKTNETYAVPDTSTKYVLAFDYDEKVLDIFDTTEDSTVSEIRAVLERYGFHKTEFDISECEITGKNLTITVPDGWFVDGRQFEVTLTEGCVRDDAGNVNAEISNGEYTFWTNKVAKPWIIVDRYTHGAGIREPNLSGVLGTTLTNETAFTTAPTGYARVRILCETPNVSIKYGTTSTTATLDLANPPAKDPTEVNGEQTGKTDNIPLADAAQTAVEGITLSEDYTKGTVFTVGSASLLESGKYYIKAQAIYATGTSTQPAMTSSDVTYEGAYKTLIYSHNPGRTGITSTNPLLVQGSDNAGEPLIAGFPMRDANPDSGYSRTMYKITGKSDYVLVSYDIVSTFRMQTFNGNWSREGDSNCAYGWVIYNSERAYW